MDTIRQHAKEFIAKREAPAYIANDGKQTLIRGHPSLGVEEEKVNNMRYEDSMKGVAAQIIKEQQRASKIKNNPEEFHWHDEYATLNFFRFICKNIGNLGNGEIEKMVTRLKHIDQKAVENHVNGAVWALDYDKMFSSVY